MENLDSHEKPTLPGYFTRGAPGRMVPHGLLVVACRQPPVDPRFRHGFRAGSSACVSATFLAWMGEYHVDRQPPPELLGWNDDTPAQVWLYRGWERQPLRLCEALSAK